MDLAKSVYDAREKGVPLIHINTPDRTYCIKKLREKQALRQFGGKKEAKEAALVQWDLDKGLTAVVGSIAGEGALLAAESAKENIGKITRAMTIGDANRALALIACLPKDTTIFFTHPNLTELFKVHRAAQQAFNLRDELKAKPCTLIFLSGDCTFPQMLAGNVLQLDDPYPTLPELKAIVERLHAIGKEKTPELFPLTDEIATKAALNMQGLTAFAAETATVMSIKFKEIDFRTIQEQRYKYIERAGMQVWKEPNMLAGLGGLEGAKRILLQILRSEKQRFGAICYFEEINKMFRGANGGDLSGMADYYLSVTLTFMADHKILGILLVGLPGTGKTDLSQAIGNEANLLTVQVDLNRMKDRMMGGSEGNINDAYKSIYAFSGGMPIFMASCNDASELPGNLLRRFPKRIYFDLPSREAKDVIWVIKMKKYNLPAQPLPNDHQWTGAEIEICCQDAWRSGITLIEAAQTVIPVVKTKPAEILKLRNDANGAYVSAVTGMAFDADTEVEQEVHLPHTEERKFSVH